MIERWAWTAFPKLGIFGGEGIARFVRDRVGHRHLESLAMRFAAVATDLRNGDMNSLLMRRRSLRASLQRPIDKKIGHEPA